MARLSLAFTAGAALALLPPGRSFPSALFVLPLILAPIRPFRRPWILTLLALAAVAGFIDGRAAADRDRGCSATAVGPVRLTGYLVAAPLRGRGTLRSTSGPCHGPVRVTVPDSLRPGRPLALEGSWRTDPYGRVLDAERVVRVEGDGGGPGPLLTRWRGHLVERLHALYGSRAPVVAALTLARKEGLDPALRDAFARSGTAHLLAISGFHVGVIALLLTTLLRGTGMRRRRVAVAAAAGTWAYVGLLGFPDAATRAAVILTCVAASRAAGRPPARWGALGTALLLLVGTEPRRILSPGFQLSFAGAVGLVAWGRGATGWARATLRLPDAAASAVGAGIAATLATTPVVAWHFERIALVGIPATLVATPLIVLALPGALASLVADAVAPGAGGFVAGGVDVFMAALTAATRAAAAPEWASVWVPRTWVPVAAVAGWAGAWLLDPGGGGARLRRRVGAATAVAGILGWPVLVGFQGHGRVELVALDVGQGDAIALRTPRGRWILVDAGPPSTGDPAGHPVVRALRRHGVTRVEALVLTHPDLDHIGGAAAVLASLAVGRVVDPGLAAGKDAYVGILETAMARGIPWRAATSGDELGLDGVSVRVLSPPGDGGDAGDTESNGASVVLAVRYGEFDALLTGDAPVAVERRILEEVSPTLEVLKVGHHGSTTSTDPALLQRAHPRLAVLSVGRGNRYGHPAAEVVRRLVAVGAEIRRTDREGSVRVLGWKTGEMQVTVERPGGR